jgi:hypothetical protein
MTHLSKLAIGAIAVALIAAGAGIGYAIGHNDVEKGVAVGRTKTTVLGEHVESSTTTSTTSTSAPKTTSTVAAVQAGAPGAQPSTPTTSLTRSQTTTATSPATSRTATATGGACGTGSANATARAYIAPVQASAGTDYRTDVSVDVVSHMDRAIELDRIVVNLDYSDGRSETHALGGVAGAALQPGQTRTFSASYITHTPPKGVSLADFAWHTAGQPQCAGRAA